MSLVDAWAESSIKSTTQLADSQAAIASRFDDSTQATDARTPIFSLEAFDAQISRGRGEVVALAAASDVVVVVTASMRLLRYNYAAGTNPVLDVELSKATNLVPLDAYIDSTAAHTIITFTASGVHETYYLHSEMAKPRPLPRLRGTAVSGLAFDAAHSSTITTGEVLVGTSSGALHILMADLKERRERLWAPLGNLDCPAPAITSIYQQVSAGDAALALVATAARLYMFLGGPGLQGAFSGYAARSLETDNFVEQPLGRGSGGCGQLALHSPLGVAVAEKLSWLTHTGLYCSSLTLDGGSTSGTRSGTAQGTAGTDQGQGESKVTSPELQCLVAPVLHKFPDSSGMAGMKLVSAAMTEHHVILLYPDRVVAVNAVSGAAVQILKLTDTRSGLANPKGLVTDAITGTVYLYTGASLYEIGIEDEDRDMWSVHLQRGEWQAAFRAARSAAQRNAVNCAEAEDAMARGSSNRAAMLWGKVTAATPTFEEIALRLVEAADTTALQTFLLTRLHTLGDTDRAQATMVATWLTELYLDQINRAMLDVHDGSTAEDVPNHKPHDIRKNGASKTKPPTVAELEKKLLDFLREQVDVVDPGVTCALLASYGRLDDLMHFASYRQDSETVAEYLVARGQATQALALLRRPDTPRELVYKFAPPLMAAAAEPTVDFWLACHPPLDPRRLLPALLRLGDTTAHVPTRRQALRYVEFALDQLHCQESAVAALAVALYAAEDSEARLLAFLKSARASDGKPLYDPHAALRVCQDAHRLQACVELLCELQAYDDAVALALPHDRALAVSVAHRPQDEAQRRTVWLAIATHLFANQTPGVEGKDNIEQVGDFLAEAEGAVKIEDILPLFPDFAHIDAFKGALRDGLQQYDAQIQSLRSEMDDATRIADALRRDMATLEKRTAAVDLSELCASCHRPLASSPPRAAGPSGGVLSPLLLFPTGNAFHGACACAEAAKLATPASATLIRQLQKAIAQAAAPDDHVNMAADSSKGKITAASAAEQLDNLIASEDPFSGESIVRQVNRPLIDLPSEATELRSWGI